jgi:long-chain acyl-CoA synthetase
LAHHRLLVAASQYHMNALFISKLTLFCGGSAVLLPRFDVEHYVRAIARHQVTWLTAVPTVLALVVRESALLEVVDRSRVERVSMGSAPLTEVLLMKFRVGFQTPWSPIYMVRRSVALPPLARISGG